MRQIKAAEVKPGMNIRFDLEGWDVKGTVARMHRRPQGMWLYTDQSFELSLDLDAPVTVLSEPQPAEPTAFGARVVAGGYEFLLSHGGRRSWKARLDGKRYAWTDLCEMGSVAVIDATPSWTVPETPEVPERIEVWPEDDEALRAYRWRDCYKNVLDWNKTRWRKTTPSGYSFPVDAAFEIDVPCTRVADA